jgi:hypothetical protein
LESRAAQPPYRCGSRQRAAQRIQTLGRSARAHSALTRRAAQASITSPEHLAAYAEYCKRALSNAVNGPLLGKRDAIAHQARAQPSSRCCVPALTHSVPRPQLARVQARADELRGIARETERGVRGAAEECVEALRGVEARRLLQLQAQADELRRQLEAVQRCAEAAAVACAGSEPPLAFLDKFATLSDSCERLSAKPVREHIEARLHWRPGCCMLAPV